MNEYFNHVDVSRTGARNNSVLGLCDRMSQKALPTVHPVGATVATTAQHDCAIAHNPKAVVPF